MSLYLPIRGDYYYCHYYYQSESTHYHCRHRNATSTLKDPLKRIPYLNTGPIEQGLVSFQRNHREVGGRTVGPKIGRSMQLRRALSVLVESKPLDLKPYIQGLKVTVGPLCSSQIFWVSKAILEKKLGP